MTWNLHVQLQALAISLIILVVGGTLAGLAHHVGASVLAFFVATFAVAAAYDAGHWWVRREHAARDRDLGQGRT